MSYLDEFLAKHNRFSIYLDGSCKKVFLDKISPSEFPFDMEKCWNMDASEDGDYVRFAVGGEVVGDPPHSPSKYYTVVPR